MRYACDLISNGRKMDTDTILHHINDSKAVDRNCSSYDLIRLSVYVSISVTGMQTFAR